jgi:hypothetical protein
MIVLRIQNAVADNIMTTIFIKKNNNDKLIQIIINSSSQAQEEKKKHQLLKGKTKKSMTTLRILLTKQKLGFTNTPN